LQSIKSEEAQVGADPQKTLLIFEDITDLGLTESHFLPEYFSKKGLAYHPANWE
jgi:hypothetical protein